jgi:hypothetical protein
VTETDIKNAAGSAREGAEHQAARTAVRGLRYLPFLHRLPGVKWMANRLAALPVLAQPLRQHHGDPAACTAFVRADSARVLAGLGSWDGR